MPELPKVMPEPPRGTGCSDRPPHKFFRIDMKKGHAPDRVRKVEKRSGG